MKSLPNCLNIVLQYFPEKTQMVINSNSMILDSAKKLEDKYSDSYVLWQIELTMTQSISFLKEYSSLTDVSDSPINYHLKFYNKHLEFVIVNMEVIAENIEYHDYNV